MFYLRVHCPSELENALNQALNAAIAICCEKEVLVNSEGTTVGPSITRHSRGLWVRWLLPPFSDSVKEQKVPDTGFPGGDPGLSNPREEAPLEAMVSSKLLLND